MIPSGQTKLKKSQISQSVSLALAAIAALGACQLAAAQSAASLERVEVTGSAIRRSLDSESSVPITVIGTEDLRKRGITTVEQAIQSITSAQGTTNTASAIGSSSSGATFADMRGLGPNKTLVLLNGERIANNAVDGSAPDLNMIPFAAIQRIEVLRDGASSLYGTDAIGGVINFITRRDFSGATFSAGYDSPKNSGGKSASANIGIGRGNLETDGFNIFGTFGVRKEQPVSGTQRDFNKRIVGGLSSNTDPANYTQDFSKFYNPAAPNCSGTALIPIAGGTQCKIVTPSFVDHSPKSDTASGLLKGTFRVNSELDLGFEVFSSRNKVATRIAPVPYGGYVINPVRPDGSRNPYFPTTNIDPTFDDGTAGTPYFSPSARFPNPVNVQPGFAYVYWRNFPNGPRGEQDINTQNRVMLTANGAAGVWDYSAKLSFNKNRVDRNLVSGYANGDMIGEGLLTGILNPFGSQSAAGTALLDDALLAGRLASSTGKVTALKASGSRELGDWLNAGRPVQVAVGADFRREDFIDKANTEYASLVVASTGVDPSTLNKGKRDIHAAYSELNIPVSKELELTGSVRYDQYSDFGSTTNPKAAFRFQPSKAILFRGSASTGFRAPSLYDLNGSQIFTNSGSYNNPINCPGGTPIPGASSAANCEAQFQVLQGGNNDLKPEKSKNLTLGLVAQPAENLKTSVDFWRVSLTDSIASISQNTLFNNYSQFSQYFNFLPGNLLSISSNCPGPKCGYVDTRLQNLGGVNTDGIDVGAQHSTRSELGQFDSSLQSTYVRKYEYQDYAGGPFKQNVSVYSGAGPIFRWQHNLTVNWSRDQLLGGLAAHHKSGYADQTPSNMVSAHTTFDAYGGFTPSKGFNLVFGIKNLTNVAPPFTNQTALFQAGGWDSRYASPLGRTFYFRATMAI